MLQVAKLFALCLECFSSMEPFALNWSLEVDSTIDPKGEKSNLTIDLQLLGPHGLAACLKDAIAEAA